MGSSTSTSSATELRATVVEEQFESTTELLTSFPSIEEDTWPKHPTGWKAKFGKGGDFKKYIIDGYAALMVLLEKFYSGAEDAPTQRNLDKEIKKFSKHCDQQSQSYSETISELQSEIEGLKPIGKDKKKAKEKQFKEDKIDFEKDKIAKIAELRQRVFRTTLFQPMATLANVQGKEESYRVRKVDSDPPESLEEYARKVATEEESAAAKDFRDKIEVLYECDPAGCREVLMGLMIDGKLSSILNSTKSVYVESTCEIICRLFDKTSLVDLAKLCIDARAALQADDRTDFFRANTAATYMLSRSITEDTASKAFVTDNLYPICEGVKDTLLEVDQARLYTILAPGWTAPNTEIMKYENWVADRGNPGHEDEYKLFDKTLKDNRTKLRDLAEQFFKKMCNPKLLPPDQACVMSYIAATAAKERYKKQDNEDGTRGLSTDEFLSLVGGTVFLRYMNPQLPACPGLTKNGKGTIIYVISLMQALSNLYTNPRKDCLNGVGIFMQWLSAHINEMRDFLGAVALRGQVVYEDKESSFYSSAPSLGSSELESGIAPRTRRALNLGDEHGQFTRLRASGEGNNCLIYSIAQALGSPLNREQADRVREHVNANTDAEEGEFLENDQNTLAAILVGIGRRATDVSIYFTGTSMYDGNSETYTVDNQTYHIRTARRTLYIFNVGNYHFEPLEQVG